MSLIRLLTTTRSLSDVKNEPSPYRMTEQGLLPKFGPRKGRWHGREKAREDARPVGEGGSGQENLGEGHGDRKDAGCSLKSEGSRKPQGNAGFGWLRGWWQRLFRRKPRRERREPVQAEFTLDLVKVVRNDLSDEEMREAKSVTREKKERVTQTAEPEVESVFGGSRG